MFFLFLSLFVSILTLYLICNLTRGPQILIDCLPIAAEMTTETLHKCSLILSLNQIHRMTQKWYSPLQRESLAPIFQWYHWELNSNTLHPSTSHFRDAVHVVAITLSDLTHNLEHYNIKGTHLYFNSVSQLQFLHRFALQPTVFQSQAILSIMTLNTSLKALHLCITSVTITSLCFAQRLSAFELQVMLR